MGIKAILIFQIKFMSRSGGRQAGL